MKDHGVQTYTSRWQQNTYKSYGGVPKVESVACRFKHTYLASCIICLCLICASYTWMQVLTIKSVNQKLCEVIFKFPFLIFWILSVFSFKFFSSLIQFVCPHNSNFCFSPKTSCHLLSEIVLKCTWIDSWHASSWKKNVFGHGRVFKWPQVRSRFIWVQ